MPREFEDPARECSCGCGLSKSVAPIALRADTHTRIPNLNVNSAAMLSLPRGWVLVNHLDDQFPKLGTNRRLSSGLRFHVCRLSRSNWLKTSPTRPTPRHIASVFRRLGPSQVFLRPYRRNTRGNTRSLTRSRLGSNRIQRSLRCRLVFGNIARQRNGHPGGAYRATILWLVVGVLSCWRGGVASALVLTHFLFRLPGHQGRSHGNCEI